MVKLHYVLALSVFFNGCAFNMPRTKDISEFRNSIEGKIENKKDAFYNLKKELSDSVQELNYISYTEGAVSDYFFSRYLGFRDKLSAFTKLYNENEFLQSNKNVFYVYLYTLHDYAFKINSGVESLQPFKENLERLVDVLSDDEKSLLDLNAEMNNLIRKIRNQPTDFTPTPIKIPHRNIELHNNYTADFVALAFVREEAKKLEEHHSRYNALLKLCEAVDGILDGQYDFHINLDEMKEYIRRKVND